MSVALFPEYKKLTLSLVLVPHCDTRPLWRPKKDSHVPRHTAGGPHHETAKITHRRHSIVCKTTTPPSQHNNDDKKNPSPGTTASGWEIKNKITARHLKNWHQQLNQALLMQLPRDIVQQPFPDALRVTLLSCDFPSDDSKVQRWYCWMLWHISPALISYQMKGLGDFPAGLYIHLNGVTWNCGSYIKKSLS